MKIPNGFIKESGVYRRDEYIFDGKHIIKESTLLPTKEEQEDLTQTKFETLEDSIREVLQYSGDIGQALRTKDVYIDQIKEGEYKVSEKKSNKTVAIITPDNNVYELKLTEIVNQDDTKELSNDKDNAKAPKEQKDVETKPKELEDLKETDKLESGKSYSAKEIFDYYIKKGKSEREAAEIIANIFSFPEITEKDPTDEDYNKLIKSLKEASYDEDFEEDGSEEFPSEEPVDEPTEEEIKEPETKVEPMDSAYFIRRPQNIKDLQDKIDRHLVNMATYQIVDEIELSQEEFDNYANNLRQDAKFLKSFRPNPTNADFTCIAVKSPEGTTLLIDNSGYDSAQYVSII